MDTRRLILRELRRRGLSQDDLASAVGLHRVTVTRYLNYSIDLAGDKVMEVLEYLGFSISPAMEVLTARRRRTVKAGGGATMETVPYGLVRELVSRLGGSMRFKAGGGPGGVWFVTMGRGTLVVNVRDRRVNDLDRLYQTAVGDPQTWDDYPEVSSLVPDAEARLLALVRSRGVRRT